ncbi:MAG: molybdopterin-dependent oxidoreductase, partial [Dethiobacter sp.]|nr:molybdopterin-dependent oxidoreductase [Dethiobacter sp.]
AGSGTAFARTLPGRRTTLARTEDRTVLVSAPANTVHTACNMCSNFCAASAITETVAGTTLVRRVEGRAGHPNTRGGLCAKGQAAVQLLYDPDRIKTPLRKRADGTWEIRSWADALNDVADGLQAIRNTRLPSTDPVARRTASRVYFLNRRGSYGGMWGAFRAEFGSKNVAASASICDAAKRFGTWLGVGAARRVRDQRSTSFTLLFGRNELEATRYRLGFTHELLQNIKTGGRLVVVDPRRTYTASKAHQYVQIIPGTDLMLILSMCRVILDNSLTAAAQVPGAAIVWEANPWANEPRLNAGSVTRLAAFRDELYKAGNQYDPAAAAAICSVPAAVITRLAGEFCGVIDPASGSARPRPGNWAAVADTASGIAQYSNGTMTAWAMNCLTGLAGGFNIAGGYVVTASAPGSTGWTFDSPDIGAQADESLNRAAGYPFSGTVGTANNEGYRTLIPYAILNGLPRTHPDFRRVPAGPLAAPADGTGVIHNANGERWTDVYGGGSVNGGGGIRGLFINHTDPAVADADSDLWARALPRLQFAVAIDVYLNTTHELFPPGSYVLPECTALERTDATTPITVSGETAMNLWQQAVAPLHNSRSGYWILASLGAAMSARHGSGDYFAPDAAAAVYNTTGAGTGRMHRHAPANEVQFTRSIWGNTANDDTVAGRVPEIRNWSNVLANGGLWTTGTHTGAAEPAVRFSFVNTEANVNVREFRQVWENTSATTFATPLAPHWRAPRNTPTSTFPLRFMAGGKVMWHTMAATANLPYLVQDFDQSAEVRHTNYLLINPTDAAARGIASGGWVFVASANGSRLRVQALVTERIMPGYVSLFHGYGEQAPQKRTAHNRGVNPNRLISSRRIDAGTGLITPKEEIVQVIRA